MSTFRDSSSTEPFEFVGELYAGYHGNAMDRLSIQIPKMRPVTCPKVCAFRTDRATQDRLVLVDNLDVGWKSKGKRYRHQVMKTFESRQVMRTFSLNVAARLFPCMRAGYGCGMLLEPIQ